MQTSFSLTSSYTHKSNVPKTSISHPINISWIIPPDIQAYLSNNRLPNGCDLFDCMSSTVKEKIKRMSNEYAISPIKGNMCLSSCPGKKVRLSGPVKGRATINRDLNLDFLRLKSFGITLIVCCLNDYELEFLGAPWSEYTAAATDKGIKTYRIPMVEGGCPSTLEDMKSAVDIANDEIMKGNNVLVHCRGGVGRAGLFACCWLLENLLCQTAERAISVVRKQRSPKAIETLKQAAYVIRYSKAVKQRYGIQYPNLLRPSVIEIDCAYATPSIHTIAQLEYDIMTA